MRAFFLVFAATICACRPEPTSTISRHSRHLDAQTNQNAGSARAVANSQPAHSTHYLECFAEPVKYYHSKRIKPITVKQIPNDVNERLLKCDTSAGDTAQSCRFEIAREYFDANRFERAGPLFLDIAHDPNSTDAPMAALLALESINVLINQAEPSRYACSEVLEEETPKLLNGHCTTDPRPGAEELCAILHFIDAEFMSCSECPARTITGREPKVAFASAGRIYLDLAKNRCIFGKGKQLRNEEIRCDNLLYRAYDAFRQSDDLDRATQARAMLLDPKNGLLQSERAKEILNTERRIEELKRNVPRLIEPSQNPKK